MCTKNDSMREEIVNCLTQQLSEIDLLQAMYPNPGDIVLSSKIVNEINNFIECKSEYIPNTLDIVINLFINEMKLELFINLPLSYPNEEPDIYIRCNQLNRNQEKCLNMGLINFLKENHVGEVCLYTAITWIQDNFDVFAIKHEVATVNSSNDIIEARSGDNFCRLWIYSHHIYNKKKREEIQKLAKELALTGFCLPGKPGVICIEGDETACNEWWREIKSMSWKKIVIRRTEIFETSEDRRKFNNFEELHFKTTVCNKHSNMSEFSKYMNNHGFSEIFNVFFGLCNE